MIKGKMPLFDYVPKQEAKIPSLAKQWPPPAGHVALSVDGLFLEQDGTVVAGMVLRRHD